MKCHVCDEEVKASSAYCDYCGAEMNREFEDVAMDLVRETEQEKQDKMEKEMENYLVMAIVSFIAITAIYYVIPNPPKVDPSAYFLRQQKKEKKELPQVPMRVLRGQ